MKPIMIVVTGRPGSGKTTLSERLSREWCLPLISRDRIKEGYVQTMNSSHDQLGDNGNLIATNAFFDIIDFVLEKNVSCIAEAAFQHRIWASKLSALQEKADIHMIVCRTGAETALRRFLDRGLNDPQRLRFHGDRGVQMLLDGITPETSPYDEPRLHVPTYYIDTTDGYVPPLTDVKTNIFGKR